MADTKPKKMTDEELAEAKRTVSVGDSSEADWTTEWGAKVFARIAALTAERDDSDRLARIRREELEKAERMLNARNEEIDALRERVQALEEERDRALAEALDLKSLVRTWQEQANKAMDRADAADSRLAAIRQRLTGIPGRLLVQEALRALKAAGLSPESYAGLAAMLDVIRDGILGEDDHGAPAPNPSESSPPLNPDATGEADQPVEGVSNSPSNPEPTTAEAFAAVREIVDGMAEGEEYRTGREVLRKELALLERRMERYTLAARMVVDATNDAQDMDEDLLAARLAAKAALTDAPPVFTPSVPAGLAALIDGFAAEVQAAEDHAQRLKGGQQVAPTGDFVRCTPSMLGRLRWWANALKAGRTTTPVFTLEEVERAAREVANESKDPHAHDAAIRVWECLAALRT